MTFPLKSRATISFKAKLAITVSSSIAVACSESILTGGTRKGDKLQTSSADNAPSTSLDQLVSVADLNKLKFEEIAGVSTQDFYRKALEFASNDPIDISGHQLSGLKDYLIDQESIFLTLAERYPTLRDYFNDLNITSEADIKLENVEAGYGTLEKILSTGGTAESVDNEASPPVPGVVLDQFSLANQVKGRTGLSLNDEQSDGSEAAAMAAAAPGSFPSSAGAMDLANKRRKKHEPSHEEQCAKEGGTIEYPSGLCNIPIPDCPPGQVWRSTHEACEERTYS